MFLFAAAAMRFLGLCVCLSLLSRSASSIPDLPLLDGTTVPSFGLGVYMIPPGEEAYNSVKSALELGYRMIDTAEMYGNEADVGRAIKDSGIPRAELYVQSKLSTPNHGYENTLANVKADLSKMGLDYFDCFLVHSPFGGKLIETWDALQQLKKDGLLRSAGVSNFDVRHVEALAEHGRPLPVVNQVEIHPLNYLERKELLDYCSGKGIIVQAYGSIFFGKPDKLSDPRLLSIVESHPGKTAAQVLLRWGAQKGFQLIPKSVKRHRQEENMNIFDFSLTDAEVSSLDAMAGQLDAYWNPVRDAPVDLGETQRYRVEL